jgi:hypothetical protein
MVCLQDLVLIHKLLSLSVSQLVSMQICAVVLLHTLLCVFTVRENHMMSRKAFVTHGSCPFILSGGE